jgi:LPPG:FO 2-phospho-L-lactate transferase
MKVVALAGGVGGAKLANGLSKILPAEDLTVIVNTGDDFIFHGLNVSPDVDTVLYTLAGINNPVTGWGRIGETWNTLEELRRLGGEEWFNVGDKDLALHLTRTRQLREGKTLTEVTRYLCSKLGVNIQILPMTNSPVRTKILTDSSGLLDFQEYFVKFKFEPEIKGIFFDGIENAEITPEISSALSSAELVVICPSNPFVSIQPILSVPDMVDLVRNKPCLAVSPIIKGNAIKGPAAKMFRELGLHPGPESIAEFYEGIINGLIYDNLDADLQCDFHRWGIIPLQADTVMVDETTQKSLAAVVIQFGRNLIKDFST